MPVLTRILPIKFKNILALAYLAYLRRNTSELFLQYFQNKTLSNLKINIKSSKCMGIFKRLCIIHHLEEALPVAAFIWEN